jgi:hypothetical protein
MPTSRIRRRPSRPLPALQTLKFGCLIERNYHIELAVRMAMKLAVEDFIIMAVLEGPRVFAVHVDGRDAEVKRL